MAKEAEYKVVVSDRARQMLKEHVLFLANVSPDGARKMKNRLLEAIQALRSMPERHPFFSEEPIPPNKYHRMFVENWYLVLYQIKDQMVYVDYILDCRQDYSWLVK